MVDFRKQYFYLFGVMADAVEALEQGNVWDAKKILIAAMQQAEEEYIEEDET